MGQTGPSAAVIAAFGDRPVDVGVPGANPAVLPEKQIPDEHPQLYELTVMLWAAWDPIGAGTGAPTDEYEVYAAPILALLQTCSSDESRGSPDAFQALVAELSRIRTERIGLEPDADRLAAWKLRDWYEWQAGRDHRGLSR